MTVDRDGMRAFILACQPVDRGYARKFPPAKPLMP